MRIEFTGKTKATIVDVDIQSLKMGQTDVKPAVSLHLRFTLANSTLKMLDKNLLPFLFEKSSGKIEQKTLDGIAVVSELPQLTDLAIALGALNWDGEQTGCTLMIYQGVTGDQDIRLQDCTVRKIKIEPNEGGSVEWHMQVYTSDVDQEIIGALGVLKSLERDVELTPPSAASEKQRSIDDGATLTPEKALTANA
jgi:hypothetical protein